MHEKLPVNERCVITQDIYNNIMLLFIIILTTVLLLCISCNGCAVISVHLLVKFCVSCDSEMKCLSDLCDLFGLVYTELSLFQAV